MFHVKQFVLRVGWVLCLSGCVVGPDFTSPPPPTVQSYTESSLPSKTIGTDVAGGAIQYFVTEKTIPAEWWRLFHSRALNELIIRGLKNSPNLQAAQAALRQAEGNVRVASGAFLPSVSTQPYAQRQRSGGTGYGPDNNFAPSVYNLYYATVNVSYTLDVFGSLQRQFEASQAQFDYQRFQLEGSLLTLTSNIVTTAIAEASLRAQIQATKQLIELQVKTLHIAEKKFQIGVFSRLDVLAQQAQLAQTQASLPPLEKSLAQTRHSLAVLIGEAPSEAKLPVFNLDELQLPTELPVSLPSSLVRQRPDVRAAEELLHVASAQIGVAQANFFPQVTLNSYYGWYAGALKGFFDQENMIWSIMATILQPIFQGGALTAKKEAAVAAFEQACAQYRQTVLQAFQNVADTLKALEVDAQQLSLQTDAEKASRKVLMLTKKQHDLGAVSYVNLLDAETQYLNAQINRIQAQASRYGDTAALFQALGGGWWNRPLPCIGEKKL